MAADTTMTTESFLAAVQHRISCYTLQKQSPISDARIHEIVNAAIKNAPSAFNVQSARAVVLVKAEHDKLWDLADVCLKNAMPEAAYETLKPRVQGFRAAYGSVLWFEDHEALDALKFKNPGIQHVIPECKWCFWVLCGSDTDNRMFRVGSFERHAPVHYLDGFGAGRTGL
jgi:uncharacterized protein